MTLLAFVLASSLLGATPANPGPVDGSLLSVAERSGWRQTGRYAEAVRLCRALAERHPRAARCVRFGTTPEGRAMVALVASADGALTPEAVRAKGRPVVFFQGGIHAGEIEGKDAGFWLLRELLAQPGPANPLTKVTAVFVPVVNIDGHERFGPNNRPNQNGPEQMGWRVTSQNLNLNRDYVKAEAPEMQALLGLLHAWDPIVYVDLHATDGAKFQHDMAVILEPRQAGPASLRELGETIRRDLFARLVEQGHSPVPFYPSFVKEDDPASGFAHGISAPRFSSSYWFQQGRFGVLVETHSWKDYATRVKACRDVVEGFLTLAARDGRSWLAAARVADAEEVAGRGEVALAYEGTEKRETIEFRGYAYERRPSAVSGREWIRYDDTRPQVWQVPFAPEVRPALLVRPPAGGYLVPAAYASLVVPRLKAHGIFWRALDAPPEGVVRVEVFRARDVQLSPGSFEGRQRATVRGAWEAAERHLPPGTLYVPTAQRARRILVHLLEPAGPDSFAAWGFFNAHFEQKEYVEDYLLEPFAATLLDADGEARRAFEARLQTPAFAGSPEARLGFFYQRHPARDVEQNILPILRTELPPEALGAR